MLKIKNILFPTDFSACAESAFSEAVYLADRFGAALHILHVVAEDRLDPDHPLYFFPLEEEEVAEQLHLNVGKRLEAAVAARREERVPIVSAHLRRASAAAGILEYAEAKDIDLIVMGTHGRTGLRHLLLGSVAEKVVRMAPCPVFTVRGEGDTARKRTFERLLVPIDFSEHARLALAYAQELALCYGAGLDLLHVVEEQALPQVYSLEPALLLSGEVLSRARAALEALAREPAERGLAVDVHVLPGHPARDIVEFAETQQSDLIVIATHGLTGIKHLLLGSVAEKVVRMAPCPVFTVKGFGKVLVEPAPEATAGATSP